MTVSNENSENTYNPDGATVDFAFDFYAVSPTDVIGLTESGGQQSGTVTTFNPDQSSNPGGVFTFSVAPSSGDIVTIRRVTPITQNTDYQPFTPFPAQDHEQALDKLTIIAQEQQTQVDALPTEFIQLTDTPNGYDGAGLHRTRVNVDENALEYVPDTFTNLTDTPSGYTNNARLVGSTTNLVWRDDVYTTLQDVVIGTPVADNDVFVWNASIEAFTNKPFTLSSLGDVNIPGVVTDNALVGNAAGNAFENVPYKFENLKDVNITGLQANDCYVVDSSGDFIGQRPFQYRSLIDVSSDAVADYDTYIYSSGTTRFEPIQFSFSSLRDTPPTLAGNQNRRVTVNNTGSALEFKDDTWLNLIDTPPAYNVGEKVIGGPGFLDFRKDDFLNLDDTPDTYVANHRIRTSSDGTELVQINDTFTTLQDTPNAYTNNARKKLRVNGGETQLTFVDDTFLSLQDTSGSYAGFARHKVRVSSAEVNLEFVDDSFLTLRDTPGSFVGADDYVVKVDEALGTLFFAPESGGGGGGIPTPLPLATDANLISTNGYFGVNASTLNVPDIGGDGLGSIFNVMPTSTNTQRSQLFYVPDNTRLFYRTSTDIATGWSDWSELLYSGPTKEAQFRDIFAEKFECYSDSENPRTSPLGGLNKYDSADQKGVRVFGDNIATAGNAFLHVHNNAVAEFQSKITMGTNANDDSNTTIMFDPSVGDLGNDGVITTPKIAFGDFRSGGSANITGVGGPGNEYMLLHGTSGNALNAGYVHVTGGANSTIGEANKIYLGSSKTTATIENSELKIGENDITVMHSGGNRRVPIAWLPDIKVETGVTYVLSEDDINTIVIHNQPTSSTYELNTTIGMPGSIIQILNAAGQGILLNVTGGGNLNWLKGGENSVGNRTIEQFSVVTLTKLADQSWTIWGNGLS